MESLVNSRFLALVTIISCMGIVACKRNAQKDSVAYEPVIKKPPATAQGMWNGTTGTSRAISGVVTDQGEYWLSYTQQADHSLPAGFYAGQGASSNGVFTESQSLRKF